MEGENTFNNLAFMKNQLQNHLTTYLDICVCMFSHNFFSFSIFFVWWYYYRLERSKGEVSSKLVKLYNFWAILFTIDLSAFVLRHQDLGFNLLVSNCNKIKVFSSSKWNTFFFKNCVLFWCIILLLAKKCLDFYCKWSILMWKKNVDVGVGCLKIFVCWFFF